MGERRGLGLELPCSELTCGLYPVLQGNGMQNTGTDSTMYIF